MGAEPFHQFEPGMQQLGPGPCHVLVPDVQGGLVAARELAGTGRFQQRIALLQHPVVVAAGGRMPRNEADQELVEETAPVGRITFDQGQVLRGEQDGLADAEDVPGTDRIAAVDAGAVGAASC